MSEVTDQCVTCKKAVDESQEAMSCDLCNQWEHVGCVRKRERPSQALYNALIECHTKTIMYVCTCCRRHGPVSQRLFQYEKELARVNDERLASARQLEERDALIGELRKVNAELLAQQNALQSDMVKLSQQMMALQLEPRAALVKQEVSMISGDAGNPLNSSLVSGPPSLVDSENDDSSENEVVQPPRRRTRTMDLHPPGFKVLITRVSKFSGGKAADNFEVWLEDYIEATGDCGWSDQQRAQWFSWFLAGPAKSTWMHSMRSTDKTNWEAS